MVPVETAMATATGSRSPTMLVGATVTSFAQTVFGSVSSIALAGLPDCALLAAMASGGISGPPTDRAIFAPAITACADPASTALINRRISCTNGCT